MTIAFLLRNTLQAARYQAEIERMFLEAKAGVLSLDPEAGGR
jgi:hypothetical protein